MARIKLCGLTRECDIEAVNELLPEYIGFVFVEKSKRYTSLEKALKLRKALTPAIKVVGVFVNAKQEYILDLVERNIIDVIQLHGQEDENYISELRAKTDKEIIKAFKIDDATDIAKANASSADYVLLDTGAGGTGTSFDWSLLPGMTREYFLAGGLKIENVEEAMEKYNPFAVDISSGIETDGLKDKDKMQIFVEKVRKY